MLNEMKFLIAEYVARQQLAYEAILQLSPFRLVAGDKSTGIDELLNLANKYKHIPSSGIWRRYGTWRYYLHGGGCRLTNIISGEPIEWDAPHLNRLYMGWFVNWLRWVERTNGTGEGVSDNQIKAMFDELVKQGFLERTHPTLGLDFYLKEA